jgi:hypothetical protein
MEDGDIMAYFNGMQVVILPSGFFNILNWNITIFYT